MKSVAVTGIGMVTPLGLSGSGNRERVLRGETGVGRLHYFDPVGHPCSCGAQVEPFDLAESLRNPKSVKFMNRSVQFGIRAAQEALSSARIEPEGVRPERFALYVGSGSTGLEYSEFFRALDLAWEGGKDRDFKYLGGRPSRLIDRYFSLRTLANAGLAFLSSEFQAHGPSNNFVQNDTASALALGSAFHDLLEGRCDLALAGGYDSLLDVATYLAYESASLLSPGLPPGALRPFDRDRDGLVLGEGAGFLVLERAEQAAARNAPLQGELLDLRFSQAWTGPERPDLHDYPAVRVIGEAGPEGVDAVVARGIGTPEGDLAEARALFPLLPPGTPVTALKGATGYLGAATTAVEVGMTLLCMQVGRIPPVSGWSHPDPDIHLNLVGERPLPRNSASLTALGITCSWSGQACAWKVGCPNRG